MSNVKCESHEPPYTAIEAEAWAMAVERMLKGDIEETSKCTINLRNIFIMLEEKGLLNASDKIKIMKHLNIKN